MSTKPLCIVLGWVLVASCAREESHAERMRRQAEQALDKASEGLDRAARGAQRALDEAQRLFEGRRDEAETALDRALARLSSELEGVGAQLEAKSDAGSAKLRSELDGQLRLARERLTELKASGEQEWRGVCRELEEQAGALGARLSELAGQRCSQRRAMPPGTLGPEHDDPGRFAANAERCSS